VSGYSYISGNPISGIERLQMAVKEISRNIVDWINLSQDWDKYTW
jgi:hypothetical protein